MARERVDVVLMDFRLPDGTGADATRAIKARWPAARVVMLTAVKDDETFLESIQAGADGYLTKDRAAEDVVQAVRAAYAGETLLPRSVILEISRRVAEAKERDEERRPIEPLTPRELEVLQALTEGLSTPEICERLFIAPNTLRTHVQNLMGKLRVHSKLEAVAYALRNRLVEPPRPEDALRPVADRRPGASSAMPGSARRTAAGGACAARRPVAPSSWAGRGPPAGSRAGSQCAARRPPLAVQERTAARAAPLLGEERLQRRNRVDLASARPAGEPGHVGNLGWTMRRPRVAVEIA